MSREIVQVPNHALRFIRTEEEGEVDEDIDREGKPPCILSDLRSGVKK